MMIEQKLQPIRLSVPEEEVQDHLGRYERLALEAGATRAGRLPAAGIPVDERVSLKCSIPKCFGYGTCANCPPHSPKPEEMRRIVGLYRWAVVFGLQIPPAVAIRDKATIQPRVEAYKKIFDIASAVESAAFYDGHYLSVGFAAGSCKSTYCYDKPCAVLGGEKCRLQLRSRPSMESVGIDCYRIATQLGWEIYPIGSNAGPGCIPHGLLMGLVLVV
jgi:predicted metal-binding protein